MIRYATGFGVALAVLSMGAAPAWATSPQGPRLAFLRWGLRPPAIELVSSDPIGSSEQALVRAPRYHLPTPYPFGSPSWSPDGSRLAFTAVVGRQRHGNGGLPVKVFAVSADGTGLAAVPGTDGGYQPIFSPDGRTLAFTRLRERRRKNEHGGEDRAYESASVWLLDLAGESSYQLTPWRNRLIDVASSFSPDGRVLAISRRLGDGPLESVAISLDGGGRTVISRNGFAPTYSPDGSRIALLRGHRRVFRHRERKGQTTFESKAIATVTDLFVGRSDGSELQRLTDTPRLSEASVSWDPSGERLAFIRKADGTEAGSLGFGDELIEINADGSCQTVVLSNPDAALDGPVWQPGPGREAGPIPC